jgi:hypothetical protein
MAKKAIIRTKTVEPSIVNASIVRVNTSAANAVFVASSIGSSTVDFDSD